MPATDAYWRNIKKTHVVFALSSVAMLAVTIWMMWHDHNREYFDHQRTFEALEVYKARARLASLDTKRFEDELKELNERLAEEKRKLDGSKDYADINARIKVNKLKMTLAESRLKLLKSQMSKAVADKDLATRDEKPESVIHARQAVYEAKKKQVDQQAVVVEKLQSEQDELQKQLKNLTRTYDGIKAKRDQKQKEVVTIRKGMLKIEPENWFLSGKRKIMEWPIIQGFNSHLKVHQDWLPKLEITLGMTRTARFDRCRTCHLGIDKVEAGNVPSFPHGKPDGKKPVDWVAENKYPHPYSTHPNPDLYLTATSPHPVSRFGCTICHDGNGSGTSFQNAEHGPNSPHDAREWKKKHHYHSNHFWEYPMQPKRLLQSGCIKCHHQVEELGVNPKYGASAPTVYKGFRLIQQYGCFGCHPVNGFERGKSIGPDMRLEPNYTESALQFRFLTKSWEKSETASGFSVSAAKEYLAQIIDSPEDSESARSKLVEMIQKDLQAKKDAQKKLAVQRVTAAQRAAMKRKIDASHLPDEALALGASFKSVENPGIYRKVGPSLRSVRQKTSRAFLRYWTEEPKRFRPTTRMPQFFGLTNQQDPHAKKLTAVELAGVAQYLHDKSQPIDLLSPPKGYVPDPKRGKEFFSQKGCLACHTHQDVKGTAATFGPDLSRIAAKVKRDAGNPKFSKWLYTWIRDPQRYHKRSKMPYLFLEPKNVFEVVGGDRKRVMQDAAADITAYLLQGNEETENLRTKTFRNHADDRFPAVDETALDELVRLKLQGQVLTKAQTDALFNSKSHKYPITDRSQIKGDEIELAIGMEKDGSAKQWLKTRLNYIGRKTISKYGCYACHDIPGFEKARPIGTTLQDWGRKETSKLAFEHIKEYLQHHGEPNGGNTKQRVEQAMNKAKGNEFANDKTRDRELSAAFFYNSILHHGRPGFIWQKLRAPRSYDYEKVETKGYDERLKMPKFPFAESDIEAIATFVLGLVAEPPPPEYQSVPTGPKYDRVEGERLLKKYNCVGCHMLELPTITFWTDISKPPFAERKRQPGQAPPATPPLGSLALLNRLMPPRKVDLGQTRSLGKVVQTKISFQGLPVLTAKEDPAYEEEEANLYPARYNLWEHLNVKGFSVQPSESPIPVLKKDLVSIQRGRGGDFAEWLFGHLKSQNRRVDTEIAGLARHKIPPVLYREGHKVQTPWLYQFLRNPHPIRPMAVLRMPRFNMSRKDARVLANYFAAVDGVPYPYQQIPQRAPAYVNRKNEQFEPLFQNAKHPDYLSQSWKLLTNPKLCRQCHSVGGEAAQQATGPKAVQGPNLEFAADRLRPGWTALWLAKPTWVTPYTKMPMNFDQTKDQYKESFNGKADVQWLAARDALMNYHQLMEQHKATKFTYPVTGKDGKQPVAPMPEPKKAVKQPPRKALPPRKSEAKKTAQDG